MDGIDLSVPAGSLAFLLGPSGCGKTTVLRMIAGLQEPDAGHVRFGDRDVTHLPAERRDAGMVFQGYALWPHMSVRDNVAFGLDVRGVPATERAMRTRQALEMVRMDTFADRKPGQLSGGQQQRVALARALAFRPEVLLLDEPLSNLDARLRLEMREEIRRLHATLRITTVYVTHDQKESLALADRMAVLREGVIEQVGPPREVYRKPRSRFVADFIGECNWLEGEVVGVRDGWATARTVLGEITGPGEGLATGDAAWVGFRPESVEAGRADQNTFDALLVRASYLGEFEEHVLEGAGATVRRFVPNPRAAPAPGHAGAYHVDAEDVLVMPRPGPIPSAAR